MKVLTYYHGTQAPEMFTYRCAHCYHSVVKGETKCPGCWYPIQW